MTTSTQSHEQVAVRKLWWVGPLTIISTALANSIIRFVAVTFFGISETFQYLQLPTVIGSTIFFLLLALLVFGLVSRFARRPMRLYRILALAALCISLLTPLLALTGLLPAPGMTLSIFWAMITMHIVSAAITITLLTTLTHQNDFSAQTRS